ncbi:hypothetical protein ACFE04_000420 [Oxalis oulophora]
MGKKLSQASLKISNNNNNNNNNNKKIKKKRQKLDNLSFQVYITECSTFKTLVQQLTGNGSIPKQSLHQAESPRHSVDISFDQPCQDIHLQYSSTDEYSSTTTNGNYSQLFLDVDHDQLVNYHPYKEEDYFMEMFLDEITSDHVLLAPQDQQPTTDDIFYMNDQIYSELFQEVSIYDYELFGFI